MGLFFLKNLFNLQNEKDGTEKNYSNHFVEIVNGIGQVVFTNMMNSSKTQISVSELGAKGLYFINIKDSNNKILVTKHLIVN